MEYTLENFELDMRKVDLYVENAVAAFNITVDEASLYSESTEYDLIVTEASDGLGAKIKAAFAKIIESIKKFFTNLIDKVKSIFTKDAETKIKKGLAANPEIGKQKIDITDIKSIEQWCGKRKILRSKLIKKCKAGTLTQEEFEKTVEQMDAMKSKMKTVGVIVASVAAAAALVTGGVLIVKHKKAGAEEVANTKSLANGEAGTMGVNVAQVNAQAAAEDAETVTKGHTNIFKKVIGAINQKRADRAAEKEKQAITLRAGGVSLTNKVMNGETGKSFVGKTSGVTGKSRGYEGDWLDTYGSADESVDDLLGYDLDDTFFDI